MAVIALASASGSPGVTTTALGLASPVAAPGPARRGRPDRRLRPAGGLLPWDAGVRRRADRAGADREQPQRRARRRRPSHRGHARLLRRGHPLAHPSQRAAGSVGAAGRGTRRTGVDRPGRHRRRRSPRTRRLARAAARRCRPDPARQPHHAPGALRAAVLGRRVPATRTRLAPGRTCCSSARASRTALARSRGRESARRWRLCLTIPSRLRCSPAERSHRSASRPGLSSGASRRRSPRSTRRSPAAATNCSKERGHDLGTHRGPRAHDRRPAAVQPAAAADRRPRQASHGTSGTVAQLPACEHTRSAGAWTGRWSLRCAPKPPSSSARRSPPTVAASTRPPRRSSAARSCSTSSSQPWPTA